MRRRHFVLLAVLFGAALLFGQYAEYQRYLLDERYLTPPESETSPVTVVLAWEGDSGSDHGVTLTAQVTSRVPAGERNIG